jgi:outer membrane receptor for Fe3+-dicitrate
MRRERRLICSLLLAAGGGVAAQDVTQLSAVEVRAQVENLEGLAMAGSEGVVSGQRLATVPLQRPGEVLEMVPGLPSSTDKSTSY